MRAFVVALLCAVAAPAQLIDGSLWSDLSPEAKMAYVRGLQEAFSETQRLVADEQKLSGKTVNALLRHFPTATVDEVRQSLDRFYQDPANRLIKVWHALEIVALHFNGASPACEEEVTAFWRRIAAKQPVRDLGIQRNLCFR